MTHILIAEDEPIIAGGLQDDLTLEGYEVTVVGDGAVASARATTEHFDLIVLDVMLPNRDGFDICRDIRKAGVRTPILMLTARAQEMEKVVAFELGADDYVTKPFGTKELRARIKALLRRSEGLAESTAPTFQFGDVDVRALRTVQERPADLVQRTRDARLPGTAGQALRELASATSARTAAFPAVAR